MIEINDLYFSVLVKITSAKKSLKALTKWLMAADRAFYLEGDDEWAQVEQFYDLDQYLVKEKKPQKSAIERFSFDALQVGEIISNLAFVYFILILLNYKWLFVRFPIPRKKIPNI